MSAKSVATLNVVLFYFLTLVMDVGEFLLAEGVLKAVCLCKTSTSITKACSCCLYSALLYTTYIKRNHFLCILDCRCYVLLFEVKLP